jgi:hypothetical protein
VAGIDAGRADERQHIGVAPHGVDHRKREVVRVRRQRLCRPFASLPAVSRFGRISREFAQQRQLALADHTLRVVGISADDATDCAGL